MQIDHLKHCLDMLMINVFKVILWIMYDNNLANNICYNDNFNDLNYKTSRK